MEIINVNIKNINISEYNPRKLSPVDKKQLKLSIEKFGIVDPLILNNNISRKNILIGGHQRLKICKELKYDKVDCVILDLTKEEERELNIRLNKSGGEFDLDILANEFEIEELKDWGFKEIDLGLNIDKIEEDKQDNYIITITEDDISKANALYKELKDRDLKVKIKL